MQESGAMEDGLASVLEDGSSHAFKEMVTLRKSEVLDVLDSYSEKRWARRNVFQLVTANHQRILYLEASSSEDKEAWIQSLDEGESTFQIASARV